MSRIAKTNLLLEIIEPNVIVEALRKREPQRYLRYEWSMTETVNDVSPETNPYRGLSAFQMEDSFIFFGRNTLTENLYRRLHKLFTQEGSARLLAILGPSGSGKSSVARAGLLAVLRSRSLPDIDTMRLVIMKPSEHPVEELSRTLLQLDHKETDIDAQRRVRDSLLRQDERCGYDGIRLFAASLQDIQKRPIVILVDQFEEIYTICSDRTERDAFVSLLSVAATERAPNVSIVLTLRSDFLGETHRHHPELNRMIGLQHEIVTAMTTDEIRRAITEPASRAGRTLDLATVDLLLAEATDHEGALPLLQFTLTQIWDGLSLQPPRTPIETLQALGGVGGALAHQAQAIYEKLSLEEQTIARRALVRMVHLGEGTTDTRRRVPLRTLCGGTAGEMEVLAVLRRFATQDARLVTLSSIGKESVAEVTHEALFEHWNSLRKWIDEGRENRRFHDRVAEAAQLWLDSGKHKGRLWRSPDLDLLRKFSSEHASELSNEQVQFLKSSHQLEVDEQRAERAHRRLRWFTITITVVLPILGLTSWVAYQQKAAAIDAYAVALDLMKISEIEKGKAEKAQLEAEEARRREDKLQELFKELRQQRAEALAQLKKTTEMNNRLSKKKNNTGRLGGDHLVDGELHRLVP